MGLQLPEELVSVLGWLGFSWPEADEERMFEFGQTWLRLADEVAVPVTTSSNAATSLWQSNAGEAIDAFQAAWTAQRSPAVNLENAGQGARILGVAMIVCAGIVLALKISVIVQLALLAVQVAQAIATAVATAGASLLEIPIFKMISELIIDQLVGMALDMILNG
ncbi:hypothetical protein JOD64_003738 [Micromonospora luteifusca]|uniref:Outer membrane channel protein CpnT-like N-terminal domain-containing protein n=1 Tax=Micromonospora luteifusca TaxID=709860 RepID=A0ABS2LWF0_9ACTN|nr:hypothetical protein [Micromonospora luteifusca]MBM7492516.1 hypothetical protein [Micromonospora luteifusca]